MDSEKSYIAYQMATTAVTLNGLGRFSQVAGLFKCNPSNICAAFYTISTDSVLAVPLNRETTDKRIVYATKVESG